MEREGGWSDGGDGDLYDRSVFERLSEATEDAQIVFDADGLILTWSEPAARLFGYAAGEVLGQPVTMLFDGREAAEHAARVTRILTGERLIRGSGRGRHRDEITMPMTVTMVPAPGGDLGFLIARDRSEQAESDQRLHEAQALSQLGLWLWDAVTDAFLLSDELYRVHGLDPDKFDSTLQAYLACVHEDDRAALKRRMSESLSSRREFSFEFRVVHPDGSVRWTDSRADLETDGDGRPVGLRGVIQDVTERKVAAQRLEQQASLLELHRRMVVAANEAADLEQATERCITDVCALTGWAFGNALFVEGGQVVSTGPVHGASGDRDGSVVPLLERYRKATFPVVAEAIESGHLVAGSTSDPAAGEAGCAAAAAGLDTVVALPLTAESRVVAVLQFLTAGSPDAELVGTVWSGASHLGRVAERASARDELSYQALHDSLTGLPNRNLLMDRIEHALARGRRSGCGVALIFLDVDHFKLINDSLGHEAGDELVIDLGRRLVDRMRASDTVARFGGDEFVVLCEDLESEEDAVNLAERLLTAVSEPVLLRGQHSTVMTASAGLAFAFGEDVTSEALLRDADLAMYRAKETGRGRFQIYDSEMHRRARERLEVANELRRAIEEGELRLFYQPQVDTATATLIGIEALVRWQHPEKGLIPPLDFIPVAEETQLIVPLGAWVLNEACRQAALWQDMLPDGRSLKMCVNVSAKQLSRPELVDDVRAALDRSGLPAGNLCIEITESVLMSDAEFFLDALAGLKAVGVEIAIDDFGTGYSSLAYLRRYPIDVIKVDKGFVDGLEDSDARSAAVMAAVVDLAHALGVTALAEGVETVRQRAALEGLGCDACQGFYFARPVPAELLSAFLSGESDLGEVALQTEDPQPGELAGTALALVPRSA